jgi:hypothetical protein
VTVTVTVSGVIQVQLVTSVDHYHHESFFNHRPQAAGPSRAV